MPPRKPAKAAPPAETPQPPGSPLARLFPALDRLPSAPPGPLERLLLVAWLRMGPARSAEGVARELGLPSADVKARMAGFPACAQEWSRTGLPPDDLLRPARGAPAPRSPARLPGDLEERWAATASMPADLRQERRQELVREEALRNSLLLISRAREMLAAPLFDGEDEDGNRFTAPKWTVKDAAALLDQADRMQRMVAGMDKTRSEEALDAVAEVAAILAGMLKSGVEMAVARQRLVELGVDRAHLEAAEAEFKQLPGAGETGGGS